MGTVKLQNNVIDCSFHTSYFVSRDHAIHVIILSIVIILKIWKEDKWRIPAGVGNDCLVPLVSTELNVGPDKSKSLCTGEEEDTGLEGSRWHWGGEWANEI